MTAPTSHELTTRQSRGGDEDRETSQVSLRGCISPASTPPSRDSRNLLQRNVDFRVERAVRSYNLRVLSARATLAFPLAINHEQQWEGVPGDGGEERQGGLRHRAKLGRNDRRKKLDKAVCLLAPRLNKLGESREQSKV